MEKKGESILVCTRSWKWVQHLITVHVAEYIIIIIGINIPI